MKYLGGAAESYNGRLRRGDDSSNNSEDGVDSQSVQFYLGGGNNQSSINVNNNQTVNANVSKYVKKDISHHPVVSSAAVTPSTYSHPLHQSHILGPHDR